MVVIVEEVEIATLRSPDGLVAHKRGFATRCRGTLYVLDSRVAEGEHGIPCCTLRCVVEYQHLQRDALLRKCANDGLQHFPLTPVRGNDDANINPTHKRGP